ncbi:MAG TPA: hypothetical protein VE269_00310, partial [Gaiellaceae bacterium]|nr:hypothetical protein [Gaiellaceae bacterium]
NSISALVRAHNNIGTMYVTLGELETAGEHIVECHRLSEHYGHHGFARFAEGGPLLGMAYHAGRWDDVIAGADAFLADMSPNYQRAPALALRSLVRLGRDDTAGAAEDAERALEVARPAGDPQIVLPALSIASTIRYSVGDEQSAGELVDEAVPEIRRLRQLGFAGVWAHGLAWVAWALGRGAEFLAAVDDDQLETPWVRGARAVGRGEFTAAADAFGAIGAKTEEAFYRLRSGEQLGPALAFYRSVRATRYIREAEERLAATA